SQLCGGPTALARAGFPGFLRDSFGGAEKSGARLGELGKQGVESGGAGHRLRTTTRTYFYEHLDTAHIIFLHRPAPGLFERVGEPENVGFAEGWPKDLQADGQLSADFSARYGNTRHARQRSSNCIYISEIHLERVVGPLTEFEGWHWRCRRHNDVDLC